MAENKSPGLFAKALRSSICLDATEILNFLANNNKNTQQEYAQFSQSQDPAWTLEKAWISQEQRQECIAAAMLLLLREEPEAPESERRLMEEYLRQWGKDSRHRSVAVGILQQLLSLYGL